MHDASSLLAPAPERDLQPGPVPSFSILMAAYQAAPYIGEAIESALAQTTPPHEIIVCDDGSTDDLNGALAPYRDQIVLVRQENRGPGAAKNAAARVATGDYLALLDSDDTYLPTRLEAIGAAAAARPDLDIVTTDAFVDLDGRAVRRTYDETWTFEVDDQRAAILDHCFIVGHAAFKRERFAEIGGFDGTRRTVDDWDLWIRLILSGSRAGMIPEPLSRYRVRPGSISTNLGGVLRGGVEILERTAAREQLSARERHALEHRLRLHRQELTLVEAQDGLRSGAPDVRRRLASVAFGRGYGLRTRAKAAVALASPGRAGAGLQRRDRVKWVGAAGVHVGQDAAPADAQSTPEAR